MLQPLNAILWLETTATSISKSASLLAMTLTIEQNNECEQDINTRNDARLRIDSIINSLAHSVPDVRDLVK